MLASANVGLTMRSPRVLMITRCPARLYSSHSLPRRAITSCIRQNYLSILLPFIEKTYHASSDPTHRAFAGLSLGSLLTYEMYINATATFSYFGLFSGALGPRSTADTDVQGYISNVTVAANPALKEKGVFVGFGNFDITSPLFVRGEHACESWVVVGGHDGAFRVSDSLGLTVVAF